MTAQGLPRVLRTSGRKPASRTRYDRVQQRGKQALVENDQTLEKQGGDAHDEKSVALPRWRLV
jgi:hypothetical protein